MTQGALPFKCEEEKSGLGLTALAGLPVYLDMARVMDLAGSIDRHVGVRKESQGWTDSQVVLALNLNAIMRQLVLGAEWATRKMKAIRYALVHIAGRIIRRSRELIIRCGRELAWLIDIRSKIGRLGLT
jgi:hypothetical protein